MMKLYVYEHCPFCVKARMIFGLKLIPFEIVMLQNDDEPTPIKMVGQKVVPILQKEDGSYMPESMDIVHYIDQSQLPLTLTGTSNPDIMAWIQNISSYVNKLLMPRYVKVDLPEFVTPSARDYFQHKKEAYIGPFAEHFANSEVFIQRMNEDLLALDSLIVANNTHHDELSTDDIHLFPILRSLSIVKGIVYPANVQAYRNKMSEITNIPLFDDIAI